MKKINILLLLVLITFNILLISNYKSYKAKQQQIITIINEAEKNKSSKPIVTKSVNENTTKPILTTPQQKTDNNVTYNLSLESNSTSKQIEEMKKISNAIIGLYNFSNGKEKAKNLKDNFEAGAIDMFNPGMTFEELEKSNVSSKTTDNKITIEKRNDAEYTVFYTYTLNKVKRFDKYIINYATDKIRYNEHYYFEIG